MRRIALFFIVLAATVGVSWADGEINPKGMRWDHNTEPDLAGYFLYEATTSGGHVLDKVSYAISIPAGRNSFDFPSNHPEGIYYWVLTAYDTSGNQSGASNEVWAAFDHTPPAPPTGCSVVPR